LGFTVVTGARLATVVAVDSCSAGSRFLHNIGEFLQLSIASHPVLYRPLL